MFELRFQSFSSGFMEEDYMMCVVKVEANLFKPIRIHGFELQTGTEKCQ
jgi:hypothetical protein